MAVRRDGALSYLFGDRLGSGVAGFGQSMSQKRYAAYGGSLYRSGSTLPTALQYTGQYTDTTGLVYMHARYYDPVVGQFLSLGTLVPDPANVYATTARHRTHRNEKAVRW